MLIEKTEYVISKNHETQVINVEANEDANVKFITLDENVITVLENGTIIYKNENKVLNTVNTKDRYLNRVKEGFKEVMNYGGTGFGYIEHSHKPAGKTGTAQSFLDTDGNGVIDTATTTATFAAYAPYDEPEVVFTIISPDVAPENVSYYSTSKVNMRISQKVSKKYFEIYR